MACLYGNYAGDNMNVKMAIEMVEDDGIVVKKVSQMMMPPQLQRTRRKSVAA